MFKYTDNQGNTVDFEDASIEETAIYIAWNGYTVLPNSSNNRFSGRPNNNTTTYFVDSLRITLGGEVELEHLGIQNKNATSGKIVVH